MSYDDIVTAGARALHELSRYGNAETTFGKCTCDEECGNLRLIVVRLDAEHGDSVVADGRGTDLWTAAIDAHIQLTQAIEKADERDTEVEELEALFNLPD